MRRPYRKPFAGASLAGLTGLRSAVLLTSVALAACSTAPAALTPSPQASTSTSPPSPDPRVGLKAGRFDAGQAAWNMSLVSNTPPSEGFVGVTNSDLAFIGQYVYQGNYNGFMIWDVTNPRRPVLAKSYLCPASQSDVSVFRNLLFVSGEGTSGRLDCGAQGVQDSVSHERLRGIRIFDATDVRNPRYIANVQTCRGSHTHTVVSDPNDKEHVYIYVSGSAGVRSPTELPGCSNLAPDQDSNSSLFRIEVIKVPLARPQDARIVSSPRIFTDLGPAPRRTEPVDTAAQRVRVAAGANRPGGVGGPPAVGGGGAAAARARSGPTQCHDITVYPAIGLAGGACGGYGLLLDISNVANPVRIGAVADTNFSFWHSATFSNDGSKILFTDEWGGGSAPRCRATDKPEWGANAIFTLKDRKMEFRSYYKIPAPQTSNENCVAHNGSLIPIPDREVMVQGWYQGGISVFDWTDPSNPKEIAFFDRGPVDSTRLVSGGSWSVYWYNGHMISSEIARGLDIFELQPSAFLSQNEIDAAKTVKFGQLNAQEQPRMVWPASFPLARAFLDQLERGTGLASDRIAAARSDLSSAERQGGQPRRDSLRQLCQRLHVEANSARDAAKVHKLAAAVCDLGAPAM
ncbi:MAG: LVIVD repeat-containing protein [Gemmatimonadota bacterium]